MIDRGRIAELERVGSGPLTALVAELVLSVEQSFDDAKRSLSASDLGGVWQAAHRTRNDALLLGARPLLAPLERLEQAARGGDETGAHSAFEDLRASWPATRHELERAAAEIQTRD